MDSSLISRARMLSLLMLLMTQGDHGRRTSKRSMPMLAHYRCRWCHFGVRCRHGRRRRPRQSRRRHLPNGSARCRSLDIVSASYEDDTMLGFLHRHQCKWCSLGSCRRHGRRATSTSSRHPTLTIRTARPTPQGADCHAADMDGDGPRHRLI